MIEIKALSYGSRAENPEKRILGNVNLEFEKGQFVSLIGHNGSGKSTLIRAILGEIEDFEGSILVDGLKIEEKEELKKSRRLISAVFQNPDNQIVATTIEEELAFGLRNLCVPREEMLKKINETLAFFGWEKYAKRGTNALSGGEKQKLAIAGAVITEPSYLILDEPTAMLDPACRDEILGLLHRLRKEKGVGIILVTHYMEEVTASDRIVVMKEGEVAFEGSPGEVFESTEILRECRIEPTFSAHIANSLRNEGVDIKNGIIEKEELVEELCRLNLKM